ncbi:hypothetical protein BCR44DRAFT_1436843 [Catenaria anguillulae PL171]|uniref:Uncharacterized protein n=1 Tax=Catenaria anguillulae PL171 TaxID=765915 RepID=A0A1Y2HKN0_9FUNG|nr:hypothetical protein BCR44DRAFT_1436843 [Catenaria anguillulae PL171]
MLRKLQKGVKILQRVCGHAKILKKASLVAPVPKARRALKEFASTLYQLNVATGLGDYVEVGTSKHRTIDGQGKGKASAKVKETTAASPAKAMANKVAPASRKRARSELDDDAQAEEQENDGNASSSSANSCTSAGSRTSAGSAMRPSTKRIPFTGPRSSAERRDVQAKVAGLGRRPGRPNTMPIGLELEDDNGDSDTDNGSDEEEHDRGSWVLTQVEANAGARVGTKPANTASSATSLARARSAGMPPPSSTQRVAGVGGGLHRSGSRGGFKVPLRNAAAASRRPATISHPKSKEYVQQSDDDEDEDEDEQEEDEDDVED